MKKLYITFALLLLVGFSFVSIFNNLEQIEAKETNYEGLTMLGLAPSSASRIANENDIDTGLRGQSQGQVFGLFESRTWETLDYGKTFISPISN